MENTSLNRKEKLEIARKLAALKVDVIEAGFPAASPGDFDSVREIAHEIRGASIAGLARALEKDIASAAQALEKADSPRIHIFLSTSKVHRDHKLQKNKSEIKHKVTKKREKDRKKERDRKRQKETERGILWIVIPGALIFKIVVMKFTAPSIDEAPAKWSEKIAISTAGVLCPILELNGG
jgi:hypothetical protein